MKLFVVDPDNNDAFFFLIRFIKVFWSIVRNFRSKENLMGGGNQISLKYFKELKYTLNDFNVFKCITYAIKSVFNNYRMKVYNY